MLNCCQMPLRNPFTLHSLKAVIHLFRHFFNPTI